MADKVEYEILSKCWVDGDLRYPGIDAETKKPFTVWAEPGLDGKALRRLEAKPVKVATPTKISEAPSK